jgi:hypothetical protein
MARKITAYACDYRCGRNSLTSKKRMEDHESRCFHNPDKRACITCKHFERQFDSNGMEGTQYLEEWVELICHATYECMDKLKNNCQLHEAKK